MENNKQTGILHSSVIHRDFDTLQRMIHSGTSLDMRIDSGNTALHLAAYCGFAEAVDLLLDNQMLIDLRNDYQETPLLSACYQTDLKIFRRLIEAGADIMLPIRTVRPLCTVWLPPDAGRLSNICWRKAPA